MARKSNSEAVIESVSAEDIAEAERRREAPSGRRRIDRTQMTPAVKRAPVRVQEDSMPSGRVLRTYQSPEVE